MISDLFKEAIESTPCAIGIMDRNGRVVYVNDACVKMWGYAGKEEMLGRDLSEFWDGDAIHKTMAALNEKGNLAGEDMGKRKDGSLFDVRFNANMFADQVNGNAYMFGIFSDITACRRTEAILRESEKKYRFITENITDIIWTMGMDLKYTYFSPSIRRLQGYSQAEALNLTMDKTLTPHSLEKALRVFAEELDKHAAGKRSPETPTKVELEVVHKNGSIIPVEIEANLILGSDGNPVGVLGVSREITERKRMEKELLEARDKLEQRVKERTKKLQDTNTALEVLLQQREKDKVMVQNQIISNLNMLVLSQFEKIDKFRLSSKEREICQIIESNLKNIASQFSMKLSSEIYRLTPSEIQVANYVKHGKSTKEIAALVNLSPKTIQNQRNAIRKKLDLANKKVNLQSFLLSLQ